MKRNFKRFISLTMATTFLAALLYVNINVSAAVSVSATTATRIEGEEFTEVVGGGYKRNMQTDDGAYALSFSPVTHTDAALYYSTYEVDVAVAGEYNVKAVASLRSQTYTSDWTIYANSEDNAVPSMVSIGDVTTGWYTNLFKIYNCGSIYLNKGINTIYWKVNENDHPEGKMQAALDYIELTPSSSIVVPEQTPEPTPTPEATPEPTPPADRQAIEIGDITSFEAETDFGGTVALGASGGKILSAVSATKINDIPVNILTGGNYMIEICGTEGKVTVSIDGGNEIALGGNGTIKTANGSYFDEGKYPYNTYVLSEGVSLLAGRHTVKITLNGDATGAAADYIKLTRMVEPTGISARAAKTSLNIGDTTNITLSGVNISDMYMVTYSTNDKSVAVVDGNGKVIATGDGETVIDVVVRKYVISKGITVSVNIDVNFTEILYIDNPQISGDTFTVKLTKVKELPSEARAYLSISDSRSGKVKKVFNINLEPGRGIQHIEIKKLGVTTGDVVKLYTWYSNLAPIKDAVPVEVK